MSGPAARNPWRHPAVALVLPALLLGLGIWQITRVDGAAAGFEARSGRVQQSVTQIQALAARNPAAMIQFQGDPQGYPAADALTRLQGVQSDLHTDALLDEARSWLAWLTVAMAALALLATATGLVAATASARRGIASRAALVSGFQSVVRVLPVLLGCVALATATAITGAVLFEVGGIWFLNSVDTNEMKLAFAGLIVAVVAMGLAISSLRQLLRALSAFTPKPMTVLGRAVTDTEAPALWAFLRDIAARQGAGVPDNIVLGLTDGFFVTQSRVQIRPEERVLSGQTLYMPATMLPLLSQGEVEAVIAHELAHFTGEDTQYSQHFLPLFASMSRTMAAVTARKRTKQGREAVWQPASVLAGHVLDSFANTVSHWSRRREFEADQAALRAGRGRDAATALLRVGLGTGSPRGRWPTCSNTRAAPTGTWWAPWCSAPAAPASTTRPATWRTVSRTRRTRTRRPGSASRRWASRWTTRCSPRPAARCRRPTRRLPRACSPIGSGCGNRLAPTCWRWRICGTSSGRRRCARP